MTTTWCSTPDRIAAVHTASLRWVGTPWAANSDACGPRGGESCHNLPRAIYIEAGFLTPSFPRMKGDPERTRHSCESVMEPWLDGRPEFLRLAQGAPIRPGDLLGIRIFHCIDHLGVVGADHHFAHVLQHKNVARDFISDPTWSRRILGIWRPVTE